MLAEAELTAASTAARELKGFAHLVGALLAFARSLGEFGAPITFVSNIQGESRTIPSAIFTYLNQPGGEAAAARLVILSVLLSLAVMVASEYLSRRLRKS